MEFAFVFILLACFVVLCLGVHRLFAFHSNRRSKHDELKCSEDSIPQLSQICINDETKFPIKKDAVKERKHGENCSRNVTRQTKMGIEKQHGNCSIRQQTILKEQTRNRKRNSSSDNSDGVKQCSTTLQSKFESANESGVNKQKEQYFGISSYNVNEQKMKTSEDKKEAGKRGLTLTLNTWESTKNNTVADSAVQERYNGDVKAVYSQSSKKDSDITSANDTIVAFERKHRQSRTHIKNESNVHNPCNKNVNLEILSQRSCIQNGRVLQPSVTSPCMENKYIYIQPINKNPKSLHRQNNSKTTSVCEKPISSKWDQTSFQNIDLGMPSVRTPSGVRTNSKIQRCKRSNSKIYGQNYKRLPLQSSNRQSFVHSDFQKRHDSNQFQPSNYNSNFKRKPSYNRRRRNIYENKKDLSRQHLDSILQFHSERVTLDTDSKNETRDVIDELMYSILKNQNNRGRFSTEADIEGSNAVGVKVGKADELDYSVDILIDCEKVKLSEQPLNLEFEDDIDVYDKNEVSSTYVDAGRRYFPDKNRSLRAKHNQNLMPDGFTTVRISQRHCATFSNCCVWQGNHLLLLPYYLLSEFHEFVGNAIEGVYGVSLNRGIKGPAVSLTIQQVVGPNVSVDITPKLTLSNNFRVTEYGWPRRDTKKWLQAEKINDVICQQIYLVPKGDKYWKISFANCEYELLRDIDRQNTWRKACLRIMKKKLMQWQSKSRTGLKGISSYLLKTTLLWLCEILPYDEYWSKDNLANRYMNFLQEFKYRLHRRHIGEYFNPAVNLLENKDDDSIDELQSLIQEEINIFSQLQ